MPGEENASIVRRVFEEAINQGNLGVIDEVLAPNFVNHDFPATGPGPEGFKQTISMFRAAFPDIRVMLEDLLVASDKVGTRGTMRGTHQGEFMGIEPTGKQVEVKYIDVWRVENGRLAENWVQMDMLGLMGQLGLAPQQPSKAEG